MNFTGYIDESYQSGQNLFSMSCILARSSKWLDIEQKWKRHIAAKNRELTRLGRPLITRYHASDCSGRHGDFQGWTRDERDAFVRGLFIVLKQVATYTVAFDVQLDELCEIFPEWSDDRLEAGYELLTTFLLIIIGQDFVRFSGNTQVKIRLFHDRTAGRGSYDPAIARAFEKQVKDPTFSYAENFTNIEPRSWEDCLALQLADLVAFECFKESEARLAARQSRMSFAKLLDMNSFGIHSKTFNRKALLEFRKLVDSSRQKADLDKSR